MLIGFLIHLVIILSYQVDSDYKILVYILDLIGGNSISKKNIRDLEYL